MVYNKTSDQEVLEEHLHLFKMSTLVNFKSAWQNYLSCICCNLISGGTSVQTDLCTDMLI